MRSNMRKKKPFSGFVIILLTLALTLSLSSGGEKRPSKPDSREKCPACGMFVSMFADWNARIELRDATHATFDGSKCMFKYYFNIKKYSPTLNNTDVTSISVKDYYSKTSIDALKAFFVIWSDVYGPMGHEPISFEEEADAKRFLREHKAKKILRFKDINPNLITSLDNP